MLKYSSRGWETIFAYRPDNVFSQQLRHVHFSLRSRQGK